MPDSQKPVPGLRTLKQQPDPPHYFLFFQSNVLKLSHCSESRYKYRIELSSPGWSRSP